MPVYEGTVARVCMLSVRESNVAIGFFASKHISLGINTCKLDYKEVFCSNPPIVAL